MSLSVSLYWLLGISTVRFRDGTLYLDTPRKKKNTKKRHNKKMPSFSKEMKDDYKNSVWFWSATSYPRPTPSAGTVTPHHHSKTAHNSRSQKPKRSHYAFHLRENLIPIDER